MLPYSHFPTADSHGAMRNMLDSVSQQVAILSDANVALKTEAQVLKARIDYLEAENARLRSQVAGASRHLPPARNSHAVLSDNVVQLPAVVERLAIRQYQFRQQGMLRQW
jgi:cell division septum initiation protein DivIVA